MSLIIFGYAAIGLFCFAVLVWVSRPLSGWGLFHWIALSVLSIFWPAVIASMLGIYFNEKGET